MERRRRKLGRVNRKEIDVPTFNHIKAIDRCRKSLSIPQVFFGPAIGLSNSTYSSFVKDNASLTEEEYEKAIAYLRKLKNMYYSIEEVSATEEKHIKETDIPLQPNIRSEILDLIDVVYNLVDGAKYSPRKAAVKELLKLIKVKINENN